MAVRGITLQGGHSDKRQAAGETEEDPDARIQGLGDRSPQGEDVIGVEQHYLDNVKKQRE